MKKLLLFSALLLSACASETVAVKPPVVCANLTLKEFVAVVEGWSKICNSLCNDQPLHALAECQKAALLTSCDCKTRDQEPMGGAHHISYDES